MSSNKLIFGLIGLTIAIIVGGATLVSKTGAPELKATQEARMEVSETNHDWGEIKIDGGKVQKDFVIKNIGSGTLSLANVVTSCMCTTAQVKVKDNKSPFFGMHAQSSWMGEIEPEEEAILTVEFDPAFHGPNGVGAITRQASLETNDSENPKITFNLSANVIR